MLETGHIHISRRNTKLGPIPNISLPPIETCVDDPPCAKLCYARKAYERYSRNVAGVAWRENLRIYREDPERYFAEIAAYLEEHRVSFFRWHVGGDIPDESYFAGMLGLADAFPDTQFLAFSRRPWSWGRHGKYGTLVVVRSVWLTDTYDPKWPSFIVRPKDELLEPATACLGSCASCKACWFMQPGDVRFIHLH